MRSFDETVRLFQAVVQGCAAVDQTRVCVAIYDEGTGRQVTIHTAQDAAVSVRRAAQIFADASSMSRDLAERMGEVASA